MTRVTLVLRQSWSSIAVILHVPPNPATTMHGHMMKVIWVHCFMLADIFRQIPELDPIRTNVKLHSVFTVVV